MATRKRPHVLSVTLTADELAKFQALAEEADMPMTAMVRGWLRRELAKRPKARDASNARDTRTE